MARQRGAGLDDEGDVLTGDRAGLARLQQRGVVLDKLDSVIDLALHRPVTHPRSSAELERYRPQRHVVRTNLGRLARGLLPR